MFINKFELKVSAQPTDFVGKPLETSKHSTIFDLLWSYSVVYVNNFIRNQTYNIQPIDQAHNY